MKLTPEQIQTIIEGLENKNTRLEATHIGGDCITNVISRHNNGDYKSKFGTYMNTVKESVIKTKEQIIQILNDSEFHSFELVTKVISETRIKI